MIATRTASRSIRRYLLSLIPTFAAIGALLILLVKVGAGTTVVTVTAIMLTSAVSPLFSSILANLYDTAELAGENLLPIGTRVIVTAPDGITNGVIVGLTATHVIIQRPDGSEQLKPIALAFTQDVVRNVPAATHS